MHEYINKYRQVNEKQILSIIDKVKEVKNNNILDVGCRAGLLSLMFSEICENVAAIEDNKIFLSPDLKDHILSNKIDNIVIVKNDLVSSWVKQYHNNYDIIYIEDVDGGVDMMVKYIKENSTNNKRIIWKNGEEIVCSDIKAKVKTKPKTDNVVVNSDIKAEMKTKPKRQSKKTTTQ
tara:strand:+ start:2282 stop:2812 length:531 start_codon:yes stop_codon:yes gene_type:complete